MESSGESLETPKNKRLSKEFRGQHAEQERRLNDSIFRKIFLKNMFKPKKPEVYVRDNCIKQNNLFLEKIKHITASV